MFAFAFPASTFQRLSDAQSLRPVGVADCITYTYRQLHANAVWVAETTSKSACARTYARTYSLRRKHPQQKKKRKRRRKGRKMAESSGWGLITMHGGRRRGSAVKRWICSKRSSFALSDVVHTVANALALRNGRNTIKQDGIGVKVSR